MILKYSFFYSVPSFFHFTNGDKVKEKKNRKSAEYISKSRLSWVFFSMWYELQDSQKSPHVLIYLINISKSSHMGLLMVLEQAGVRAENWTLIPWVTSLFLPLNLHLNDFRYAILRRAIAYKQESSECSEKTGCTMVLSSGRVSVVRVSLSYFVLCTRPTHCITAHTSACVPNELLKVKSGPTDIRQNSLWLWWTNLYHPVTCKHADAVPVLKRQWTWV